MAIEVELEGRLNPILIGGTFEGLVSELNLHAAQNKQFILVKDTHDMPQAFNVQKVTTARPQTPEEAFFSDTIT